MSTTLRVVRAAFAAISIALAVAGAGCTSSPAETSFVAATKNAAIRIYVGTYTAGDSAGIYTVDFDPGTGRFVSTPRVAVQTDNPSFLALHPQGRVLYAVNELQEFQGRPSGALSAFAIDGATGNLSLGNQQSSSGRDPCFLVVDPSGRHLLVANYTSGSVSVLPIYADGRLGPSAYTTSRVGSGPVKRRQDAPHAHHIVFDPSKRLAIWTDLGTDRVVVDRFDADTGRLEPHKVDGVSVPPGSGPRHVAWHPSGRVLYVLNELNSTLTTLRFDAAAATFTVGNTIAAREAGATAENTAAEIAVAGDGRFLYTSNRGDDNVMVFAVDPNTLLPSPAGRAASGGRVPRHFAIDPSGRWMIVANQESNSLIAFRIDASTGLPAQTPERVTIPSPVHVLFIKPE